MDTKCQISVEALAIMGFDYKTIQLLALEKPWHRMVEEETVNMPMAVKGDHPKPADEKPATISAEGGKYSVADANDDPVFIDFENMCLSDHDGDLKVGLRMEDPDYMKNRLLEWVEGVAVYVRFLHASVDIT
jgi:hypothetical protein